MKMQPQLLHVCSNGLYSIRKPRQLLADQLCKNLAQAPSILSLWVECSRFDKKLQTPTSPSGRKVWEAWGLLAERAPSPSCPSWTCHHLSPGQAAQRKSQHPRAPCLGHRGEHKGWKKQPFGGLLVLQSWLSCTTTTTTLGSSASLLSPSHLKTQQQQARQNVVAGVLSNLWQQLRNTQGFWLLKAHSLRREVHT